MGKRKCGSVAIWQGCKVIEEEGGNEDAWPFESTHPQRWALNSRWAVEVKVGAIFCLPAPLASEVKVDGVGCVLHTLL